LDLFPYDHEQRVFEQSGIENYVPLLSLWSNSAFAFVYYADEMEKANLDPESIKTWTDMDEFLEKLKAYVDKNPQFSYVLDTGWDAWIWGDCIPIPWAQSLNGGSTLAQRDLYTGKIRWDDMTKNPYVVVFEKLKEYYDKGYLPKNFWTRQWEPDFEAGFIAKKSLLCYHGPWIWDKVIQANPDAKLGGFLLPASNEGLIALGAPSFITGEAIYAAHKDKPIFEEIKKAFIWWTSPEIIKQISESLGRIPTMDLKAVGAPNIDKVYYKEVMKPLLSGELGANIKFDMDRWPSYISKYRTEGKPPVFEDDANITLYSDYFTGKITLEDFMKALQKRFDENYIKSN